jgi:uncharacterized membrane protein
VGNGDISAKRLRIKFIYLVLALTLLYFSIFSYISVVKYFAMNADVWDLGYSYGFLSSIAYAHTSSINYVNTFFYQGIIFIIFPIAYFRSLPALLIFQVAMLALPIYIIYEISRMYKLSDKTSFLISLSYFFYFPLAGAIWFDFHFQIMFIPLFLVGYWLYLKDHKLSAGIFFILSGIVRFPYMGLVILVIFSMILTHLISRRRMNKDLFISFYKEENFLYIIFFISIILLAIQYLWISHFNSSLNNTHISGNFNPLLNINDKIIAILIVFGFLLFIPMFSIKWILPMLPFLFLVFFANNPGYYYPLLFTDWYIVSIVPFLFLGLIEIITKIQNSFIRIEEGDNFKVLNPEIHNQGKFYYMLSKKEFYKRLNMKLKRIFSRRNSIYFIILLLVSSSVIVEPYGPLNNNSFNNFNVKNELNYNMSIYMCSLKIINLIPYNEQYVLVQNDLPQLFVHDLYIKNIEVSPYNIGPNITSKDIKDNNFPFYGGNGVVGSIKINYVLVNLNNIHSLTEPSYEKNFPTMDQIFKILLSSNFYGIEAYGHGIILLKRNYSFAPIIFNMSTININLQYLQLNNASYNAGRIQIFPVQYGEVSIYGPFPYLNLIPFNYTLTLNVTNYLVENLKLIVFTGYETAPNETYVIIGANYYNLSKANLKETHLISLNFTTNEFLSTFQIDIYAKLTSSILTINSIKISPNIT